MLSYLDLWYKPEKYTCVHKSTTGTKETGHQLKKHIQQNANIVLQSFLQWAVTLQGLIIIS